MIALDTHIWARAFLGDDPAQSPAARAAIEQYAKTDGIFLPLLLLVELSWVLKSAPGWDVARVHDAIRHLLDVDGVEVEAASLVREALGLASGTVGLVDHLATLLIQARGCSAFLTFDARLAKTGHAALLKA